MEDHGLNLFQPNDLEQLYKTSQSLYGQIFALQRRHRMVLDHIQKLNASQVSIAHLPTELLLIIFKFVYLGSLKPSDREKGSSFSSDWKEDTYMFSEALFPYSLAAVCRKWRDIVASVPCFWTRVFINVGKNPTPLSMVDSYLKQSYDLPIEVTVSRHDGFDGDDPLEGARVAAVVSLIGPHLYRCLILHIFVRNTNSLPSLGTDIYGSSDHLVELLLDSRENSSSPKPYTVVDSGNAEYPALQVLRLDGRNLHSYVSGVGWRKAFSNINNLCITHYTNLYSSNITLVEFLGILEDLHQLTTLTIAEIDLEWYCNDTTPFELNLATLDMYNISDEILAEMFHTATVGEPNLLRICRCSFFAFHEGCIAPAASQLVLEEVSSSDGLADFLRSWNGYHLKISRCCCMDDAFLEMLSDGGQDDSQWICPNLGVLDISHCSKFSVGALRGLVEARQRAAGFYAVPLGMSYYSTNLPVFAIRQLEVLGHCGKFSEEELEWFTTNVQSFSCK